MVGGQIRGTEYTNRATVYDIESDTYSNLTPTPYKAKKMVLNQVGEHFYIFGGYEEAKKTAVARISMNNLNGQWESLSKMETGDFGMVVVPYN